MAQGCTQVNISDAPTTSSGGGDMMALCPNECELLEIIVNAENPSFTWTTSCSGYPINSSSAAIEYCANGVPQDCLGVPISITATVTNECGSDQASWSVQTNACEIYVPNIFTPNGDSENNEFYIRGLENYNNVELYVFNRWGNKVFESTNYLNNWTAEELSDGTYWYIIKLPYGQKTEYKGNITIMR
ncbi:MAG: gliding motility-associated C-terminal domain-containing protein [Flavobacteriales bacterium]|nr:gliding motility-associated C-terminal domain-containing protein [Flavobacteriales bacterium]